MAQRPIGIAKQVARRRVVEEDRVAVGHFQLHPAKRIARPRLLHYGDPAIRALGCLVAVALCPSRVVEHAVAQPFTLHDALRHSPGRVEHDTFDHFSKLRCRGAARLTHDGSVRLDDLVIDRQAQLIFGHVCDEIHRAQIAREPAPAIHIGADELALFDLIGGRRSQFSFQLGVIRVGWRKVRQSSGDVAAFDRLFEQISRAVFIPVRIDHEPLCARIHRRAAIAHIFDQPTEVLRGQCVELIRQARSQRCAQRLKIVICRVEAFCANPFDH